VNHFDKPSTKPASLEKTVFCLPSKGLGDSGKVQLGGQGPAFRKLSIDDKGKVRLGGQGPVFRI
jgi:hypothetical protein